MCADISMVRNKILKRHVHTCRYFAGVLSLNLTVFEREERPTVGHELQGEKGGVLWPNLERAPKTH